MNMNKLGWTIIFSEFFVILALIAEKFHLLDFDAKRVGLSYGELAALVALAIIHARYFQVKKTIAEKSTAINTGELPTVKSDETSTQTTTSSDRRE